MLGWPCGDLRGRAVALLPSCGCEAGPEPEVASHCAVPCCGWPCCTPGLKCVVAGLVGLGQSAEGGALLRVLLGLWAPSAVCCGVLCTEHQSQRHPSHPQGWRSPCDRTRAALPAPWGPRAAWSAAAPSLSAQVCAVCPGPADRSLCPSGLWLPTVLEGASLLWSRRGAHRLSVRPQVRGHVEKVSLGQGGHRGGRVPGSSSPVAIPWRWVIHRCASMAWPPVHPSLLAHLYSVHPPPRLGQEGGSDLLVSPGSSKTATMKPPNSSTCS